MRDTSVGHLLYGLIRAKRMTLIHQYRPRLNRSS